MSQLRYKIVFDGSLMPDTSMDTVKTNLASLFKSDRARINTLFGRGPIALKRDLAEDEANQYLTVLQRAGARARIEPDLAAALSLEETDEQKAANAPPPTQTQQSMTCPKCEHQQNAAPECSACGVIIDKYLARQAVLAESTPLQPTTSEAKQQTPYAPPRANIDTHTGQTGELKVNSFKGRIGRMRYLAWSLLLMFAFVVVIAALSPIALLSETLSGLLIIAATIGMLVISVQIGVQRLHDIGWTGWLWLLSLVPIVNNVFWIIMLVVPGSVGSNRFGPEPPPNSLAVNLLAGLFLLLIVGSLLVLFLSGFAILAIVGMFFDQMVGKS